MTLLTKSLFTTSLECPRKLYYATHRQRFDSLNSDNDFMKALAEGGIQVGALARHYFFSKYADSKHYFIETKDKEEALRITAEAMKQKKVVIAEAAFQWKGCFVRADILVKDKDVIHLIEVKSSSVHEMDKERATSPTKKGEVNRSYRKYIYDLAFQKYVVENALGKDIKAFLTLINSDSRCDIDGLNQMIRINTTTQDVDVSGLEQYTPPSDMDQWLLTPCDMNEVCDAIIAGETTEQESYMGTTFKEYVQQLTQALASESPLESRLSSLCKACEYRSEDTERSGYHCCWRESAGFQDEDFMKPHVLELWGGGGFRKLNPLIKEGKYFLADLKPEDFYNPKDKLFSPKDVIFNSSARRHIQIIKQTSDDSEATILAGIKDEMARWKFPLHFIDFETCTVAIPFSKDRAPYETIAFQFSHHQLDRNGKLTHTEWISTQQEFPNFKFVRALKRDLEGDGGTIFRYSHHENSVLNQIAEQLAQSNERDREELVEFIKSITHNKDEERAGERNMVDLCEVVVDYFYDPTMEGSNSIKVVLPAVLRSKELQKKYRNPYRTYVDSDNFKMFDFSLINYTDTGHREVGNPYKYLPPIGAEQLDKEYDFGCEECINNGGLANANYARLQYDGITDKEREKLKNALLRYCELDTMAMVLIYEYFLIHS